MTTELKAFCLEMAIKIYPDEHTKVILEEADTIYDWLTGVTSMVWQPIEAAPQGDGATVLGWDPTCDGCIEIYRQGSDWVHTWDHETVNNDCTHWMPITPPDEE
jgi:hypothetical protein